MNARLQTGTTTVEFAIVAAVTLALILAAIEFGRILFTLNVLDEGARRASRVAAVCAVGDGAIADAAVFLTLPGLTDSNVVTEYLDEDSAVLGDPAGTDYPSIRYTRIRIIDYDFPVAMPFITATFAAQEVSSTMPRESLGVPKFGDPPAC